MIFSIENLLCFFDQREKYKNNTLPNSKHTNAINAILGEEYAAASFKHYLDNYSDYLETEISNEPCTTGRKKGHRLDRWIIVKVNDKKRFLYQTEIKNWNANGFGGSEIKTKSDIKDVIDISIKQWGKILNHIKMENKILHKVLEEMKYRSDPKLKKENLLIFWFPITNQIKCNTYFQSCFFKEKSLNLNVFSVSLYLRFLYHEEKRKELIIDDNLLVSFKERLNTLKSFIVS
jgi:hypothetical protein